MKTVDISVVSALGPHLQSDTTEPLFVTKDGHTVAAIMPASDEDVESLILSVNPKFQAILERSQQRLESEGGISSEQIRQRFGLPRKE